MMSHRGGDRHLKQILLIKTLNTDVSHQLIRPVKRTGQTGPTLKSAAKFPTGQTG